MTQSLGYGDKYTKRNCPDPVSPKTLFSGRQNVQKPFSPKFKLSNNLKSLHHDGYLFTSVGSIVRSTKYESWTLELVILLHKNRENAVFVAKMNQHQLPSVLLPLFLDHISNPLK